MTTPKKRTAAEREAFLASTAAAKPARLQPTDPYGAQGFALLVDCHKAMAAAGWTAEEIGAFDEEAANRGYAHLLALCLKYTVLGE